MKPYGQGIKGEMKGCSGCRKSKDTPHRRRCLRVDKKRARRSGFECFECGSPIVDDKCAYCEKERQEKLAREKGLEDVWDTPIGRGRPRRPRGCGSPE